MTGVDQRREIRRASEPAGRREQPGRLIAPGAVERMLGDRQEFDMGETEIAHIGRKLVGELAIGQPAAALVRVAAATSRDALRRSRSAPRGRCSRQAPSRRRDRSGVDDDRRGLRAQLGGKRHRIGFERQQLAVGAEISNLYLSPASTAGHKDFPEAVAAHAHGMAAAVPIVEIADDADAFRIRRKHREGDARDALVHDADARRACRRDCRCVPSPSRWRSRSDSTGGKRYGSSNSTNASPKAHAQPIGAARCLGAGPTNNPASWMRLSGYSVPPLPIAVTSRASGRKTRTTATPSSICGPR